MINNIVITDIASYDSNGIEVTDLKKVNFFYGANGCGKTTISNYLADTDELLFNACSIDWEGGQPLKTLVYNKQFRDNNFGTGAIAGVFTLGQATREDIEHITNKKVEVTELRTVQSTQQATLISQKDRRKAILDSFTNDCWGVYKQYEGTFKEALYGHINSKVSFRAKILADHESNLSAISAISDLEAKAATLFGEPPIRIDTIPTIDINSSIDSIEQDAIWQKVIIGKTDVDIAGLITKLGNSDWVNQGRDFIADDQICPFCQQPTVGEDFRSQIEEYFDEDFKRDKVRLADQQTSYSDLMTPILSTLEHIETSEKAKTESKLDVERFSSHLRAIHSRVSENKILIAEKLEKTSQKISLSSTKEDLEYISAVIEQANEAITSHNLLVDNYDQEVSSLKIEVWLFLVDVLAEKIHAYVSTANGLQRGIDNISDEIARREENIRELDREIVVLSRNVTSVQPAVDEINRLLTAYGFTNFLIVPSPEQQNHYAIQRENGEQAQHTLSEGEVTFITFLYFVQLAKGALDQNSVTEDRVLVIDDPISSLDSNILYVVSTIVKDLIKETKLGSSTIKQMLLLTHNVYFHKEASFISSRSNGDRDTNYWIIRKGHNISSIQAFGQNNPIESSYELLWREIKEWRQNSGISLQNTMRRIIENYFKILGRFTDEGIVEKFDSFEEQQICRSLISWINDGSHAIPDDLYIQTPDDSAQRYLNTFKKIFEYTNNQGHYQMMMGEEV
ncbi:AAA family ATPase [Teredinibacter waterburyi]|uniref:AAA family ATPase n=1 Tax=Teredinibacter waterburyi TaxID=1500538 RepID=UPI00165F8094|nr:AAA family ATPase [Teredinibacter waterburyi]